MFSWYLKLNLTKLSSALSIRKINDNKRHYGHTCIATLARMELLPQPLVPYMTKG